MNWKEVVFFPTFDRRLALLLFHHGDGEFDPFNFPEEK